MLLTVGERKWAIAGGAVCLSGILFFIAISLLALIFSAVGNTEPVSWADPYLLHVLQFTLLQACLSTMLSVGLAIPVAVALARQQVFPGRVWLIRLMALPMGLPVLIGAMGIIGIWGRQGLVNGLLTASGFSQGITIYGLTGILIGHVFFNLPLATRLLLAGLERVPVEHWRLADSLGMGVRSSFRFVEWPVLRPLLPGAASLVFMLCATSFTLVLVLGGGPAATTLEVAIYQALRFDFDPVRAMTLSAVQIAAAGLVLSLMLAFAKPMDNEWTAAVVGRRFLGRRPMVQAIDRGILLLAVLFLLLPLGAVAVSGLSANLLTLIREPIFLQATLTSLAIAFSAGLLALFLSLAVIQARAAIRQRRHRNRRLLLLDAVLGSVPSAILLVPPIILATGWFLALRPVADPTSFAALLIVVINALMAMPFVSRVLEPAYRVHQDQTLRLSASLGLVGFARWRIIDWPALRRSFLMALSFAMALSLGDLGAVALFGSDSLMTLPWLVYSKLGSYRTNDADGYALLLALLCLLLTMLGTMGQARRAQRGAGRER